MIMMLWNLSLTKKPMHYHHDKHHLAYVNNLNKALENYPELHDKTLIWLLQNLENLAGSNPNSSPQ